MVVNAQCSSKVIGCCVCVCVYVQVPIMLRHLRQLKEVMERKNAEKEETRPFKDVGCSSQSAPDLNHLPGEFQLPVVVRGHQKLTSLTLNCTGRVS